MAKIRGVDRGLVGKLCKDLDFYYWKGIACVRTYPRHIKQPGSKAQQERWEAFRNAINLYNKLSVKEREGFKLLCSPSVWTGKDLFTSIALKGYKEDPEGWAKIRVVEIEEKGLGWEVKLTKTANAEAVIAKITEEEKGALLLWEEVGLCIRGKKWHPVYKLYDTIERAKEVILWEKGSTTKSIIWSFGDTWKYLTAKTTNTDEGFWGRIGLYILE